MAAELTTIELSELAEHETVIEVGIGAFVEVGDALLAIRDKRLYRAEYSTFEDYCRERWGMGQSRAYQLMGAAQIAVNVSTIGRSQPATEREARPLRTLSPDDQRVAWQVVTETAPDGKITAGHVQAVVNALKDIQETGTIDPESVKAAITEEIITAERNGRQKPKTNRAGNEYVPQGFDLCQTPAYALGPLLPYLSPKWTIWEPAQGEGLMVEALRDGGVANVIGSDLQEDQNFFDTQPDQWDCLVTNPPYSIKYKWLERCYELGKPFALLIPVETLGAKTAQVLFREHGVEVIFMDRRINFKMPLIGWDGSAAQFPVAWFSWGLNIGRQMTFARMDRNANR
ncbi:MAG: hypothetical protein WC455_19020 [Dehalococcoidia bacterium]